MLTNVEKVLFTVATIVSLYLTWRGVRRIVLNIGGGQGNPGGAGEVIDAIHGGVPLVLEGLHPHDRRQGEGEAEGEDSPA